MSFQITCQYPKGIVFKEHVTGLERKYEQSGWTWWYEILVGWIGLMMTHWVVDRSIATSEESLHIYMHTDIVVFLKIGILVKVWKISINFN